MSEETRIERAGGAAIEAMQTFAQVSLMAVDMPETKQAIDAYVSCGLTRTDARSLEELAAQLITVDRISMLRQGEILSQANVKAKYGTWSRFLERVGHTEAGARNLMNVYRRFSADPEFVAKMAPTALYMLGAPKADPKVVKQIVEDVKAGKPAPSPAQVKEALKVVPLDAPKQESAIEVISLDAPKAEPAPAIQTIALDAPQVSAIPVEPGSTPIESFIVRLSDDLPPAKEATWLNNAPPRVVELDEYGMETLAAPPQAAPPVDDEDEVFGPEVVIQPSKKLSKDQEIIYRNEILLLLVKMHQDDYNAVTLDPDTLKYPSDPAIAKIAQDALAHMLVYAEQMAREAGEL